MEADKRIMIIPHITHIQDGVYIGRVRAHQEQVRLQAAGIRHILKLYEAAPYWPDSFVVCDNEVEDGVLIQNDKLVHGVAFLQEQVAMGKPVVSICGAGMSRSVTFVLAYLLETGLDLRLAWELVATQHPSAQPAPQMWQTLIDHYQLPYEIRECIRWMLK